MTTERILILYCIGLTLIVGYLLIVHYADRVQRSAVYSEMAMSVSRCNTAEKNCTRYEGKAAEHSASARHAANDAKVHRDHAQGLHDCLKPQLPTITATNGCLPSNTYWEPIHWGGRQTQPRPDDTVDFEPTPTIDPEGRTGEMLA